VVAYRVPVLYGCAVAGAVDALLVVLVVLADALPAVAAGAVRVVVFY
jgi:hypothetical protein